VSIVVGIDLSTKRIDLAAIPLDPDDTRYPLCETLYAGTDFTSIFRVGEPIRSAIRWFEYRLLRDTTTLAVEKPAGRHVHPSLHELHGIIRASIPTRIQTTSLYPVEWRQAIGLTGRDKNNKAAGNRRVIELYPACDAWDEHQLDALGIAHAWRAIQWRETEGAA